MSNIYLTLETSRSVGAEDITLAVLPDTSFDVLRYTEADYGFILSLIPPHNSSGGNWFLYNPETKEFEDTGTQSTPSNPAISVGRPAVTSSGSFCGVFSIGTDENGVTPTLTSVAADAALAEPFRQVQNGKTAKVVSSNGAVITMYNADESALGTVTKTTETTTWSTTFATGTVKLPEIKFYTDPRSLTYDVATGAFSAADNNGTAVTHATGETLELKRNISQDLSRDQLIFSYTK